jgi:hypothetical protein
MARVGLPPKSAKLKAARIATASLARSRSTFAPTQLLTIGVAALAFRAVSVLLAALSAAAPHAAHADAETTFGIAPVVVRFVDRSVGRWLVAPITPHVAVAWFAFACAMAMLVWVAQLDTDGDRAELAVLLAAVFPFAQVFGTSSADAIFLLFALAAFYGFRRQRWIVGGLCGAGATAAAPFGMLILPALAWIGLRDRSARRLSVLTGLALATAGIVGYLSYLYYRGGPLGGWMASMDQWGFQVRHAPWVSLSHALTSAPTPTAALSGWITVLALATVPLVWWQLDGGYAIYMIALLTLAMMGGDDIALGRTCALLFPMFVLAARIRWRVVVVLLAITCAMLYALGLMQGL